MNVVRNILVALALLVGTTICIGLTVREEGESVAEVALAGVLYAAVMVPVLLPGLVLYLLALRRLVRGRSPVEARVVAVAIAPLAVVLLVPALFMWFGLASLPWAAAGTAALGLLARLPLGVGPTSNVARNHSRSEETRA